MDLNPAAVRGLRRRFPKAICQDDVGATSDLAIFGLRELFFVDSKGDVKQFFGLRFCLAWT